MTFNLHWRRIEFSQVSRNQMALHTEATEATAYELRRVFTSVVDTNTSVIGINTKISSILDFLHTSQSRLPSSLGYPWEASSSLAENVLLCDAKGEWILLPMLFFSSPKVSTYLIMLCSLPSLVTNYFSSDFTNYWTLCTRVCLANEELLEKSTPLPMKTPTESWLKNQIGTV